MKQYIANLLTYLANHVNPAVESVVLASHVIRCLRFWVAIRVTIRVAKRERLTLYLRVSRCFCWSERQDLNLRHPAPKEECHYIIY